jgi:hypothetical protein
VEEPLFFDVLVHLVLLVFQILPFLDSFIQSAFQLFPVNPAKSVIDTIS